MSDTVINVSVIGDRRFFMPLVQNLIMPQRFLIGGTTKLYETQDQFRTITAIAPFGVGTQNLVYGGVRNGSANPDVIYYAKSRDVYARATLDQPVARVWTLPTGSGNVVAVASNPTDWMQVFLITSTSQVYGSSDGGSTWSPITGNLITGAGSIGTGRMITVIPGAAGYLAVGTESGVYASPLASLGTWSRLGTGLPIVQPRDIVYDATDDVLVIGTYARGAFALVQAGQVFNTVPRVDISGPTSVTEGTTTTYTFTVSDANVGDTFTVDSLTGSAGGSLVPDSLVTTATGGSFQVSYPDGPARPTISLVVEDSYAAPNAPAPATVTVSNVAPTAAILGAPTSGAVGMPIDLGSAVTDPGTADTSAGVSLAWRVTRNGSPFASGSGASFSFTPTAAATYVVTLDATDTDGATGSAAATITMASSNLTANTFSVTVDEGQVAANSGTYSNLNGNAVAFTTSVGMLRQPEQTIFVDTFNSEPQGLGRTVLSTWNVTSNTVDVVEETSPSAPYPGQGRFLDMDGSPAGNATIQTKTTFNLIPGTYRLSFKIGQNNFGSGNNSLHFTVGSALNDSVAAPTPLTGGMTPVVRQFTVASPLSTRLIFTETGPVDAGGSILDDVKLVRLDAPFGQTNSLNVLGYWQLGEDDPGAANGLIGNQPTLVATPAVSPRPAI